VVDNMFAFSQINVVNLQNMTHILFSLRRYLLWAGASPTGNISISDMKYAVVQGLPTSNFFPGYCTILELNTYHTLEMRRVSLIDGRNILLMYNLYWSVKAVFEGLQIEELRHQRYYLILAYLLLSGTNNTLIVKDPAFLI
jgi:hypothetical protein